ncbi:MAG: hypothetical protein ACYTGZ_04860 [Planctomycetota bacterium]|jgi:hypothetical protein
MQKELVGTDINLLGVNQIGAVAGNGIMCTDRDLPWLQDEFEVQAWDLWQVTYRDVYILDANNDLVGVYNLTKNRLEEPAKYDELKAILLAAAAE